MIRRRPHRAAPAALTAAAAPVTDPAADFRARTAATRGGKDWQTAAWAYLGLVGELRYYTAWRAAKASRVRLFCADLDKEGRPGAPTANPFAAAVTAAIGGGPAGQAQLLKRVTGHLTVTGQTWVAMVVRQPPDPRLDTATPSHPPGTEQWVALSPDEINHNGPDTVLRLPDGCHHRLNLERDLIFRVWDPDERDASQPTSAVKSALPVLNEIVRSTAVIDTAGKSRLVGNGILFVPKQMSLPRAAGAPRATPTAGGAPNTAPVPDHAGASSQQLQDLIFDVGSTAYDDADGLARLVPLVASVAGEWIKEVKHVTFGAEIDEKALKTREAAIRRLAMSLDVSPERMLGMGSNTNHWTAWQISDEDVSTHIAPPIETVCDALTSQVLRPMLARAGMDPDRCVVWYDTTAITEDPDKTDEATTAYDRGLIRGDALRRRLGLDEGEAIDTASPQAWQQWASEKVWREPTLITALLPLLPDHVRAAYQAVAAPPTTPPSPPAPDGAAPAVPADQAEPPEPDPGQDTAAARRAVAGLCVRRALELAGKRMRTKGDVHRFAGAAAHERHLHLDPVPDAATARRLLAGWDDTVDADEVTALGMDPAVFASRVNAVAQEALLLRRPPTYPPGWF